MGRSPHVFDIEFLELGAHIQPEKLRETIQAAIDRCEGRPRAYDAVLLLFGLCGNAGTGLRARSIPLVMPRAHDCCTVLLGDKRRYEELFRDAPSTPFSSAGYMERGDYFIRVEDGEYKVHYGDAYAEMVAQYGEENARYIWETMHPPDLEGSKQPVYIELAELAHLGYEGKFAEQAAAEGLEYRRVEGSLRLIAGLINGDWDPEDFVIVQPGECTQGVYDFKEIVRATPCEDPPDGD